MVLENVIIGTTDKGDFVVVGGTSKVGVQLSEVPTSEVPEITSVFLKTGVISVDFENLDDLKDFLKASKPLMHTVKNVYLEDDCITKEGASVSLAVDVGEKDRVLHLDMGLEWVGEEPPSYRNIVVGISTNSEYVVLNKQIGEPGIRVLSVPYNELRDIEGVVLDGEVMYFSNKSKLNDNISKSIINSFVDNLTVIKNVNNLELTTIDVHGIVLADIKADGYDMSWGEYCGSSEDELTDAYKHFDITIKIPLLDNEEVEFDEDMLQEDDDFEEREPVSNSWDCFNCGADEGDDNWACFECDMDRTPVVRVVTPGSPYPFVGGRRGVVCIMQVR